MRDAAIVDETGSQIGTFVSNTLPHGDTEEIRQGTIYKYAADGSLELSDRPIDEYITVVHSILWRDERDFPNEVACIESYPSNYYEIGKRVSGTWIAAGVIFELDMDYTHYGIKWGKAFSHLPKCNIIVTADIVPHS